jgi:cytochrome c peroxidase
MRKVWAIFLFLITLVGCAKDAALPDIVYIDLKIPAGFPKPEIPADNRPTKTKVTLGKKLFFETRLSKDNSISCASCHKQQFAFADNQTISKGIENRTGFRNAQPLQNLAWSELFFRDGGVIQLDLAPLNAISSHDEMASNLNEIISKLKLDATYKEFFRIAFQDTITGKGILQALGSYQRTLISGNSRYDQFAYQNNTSVLTEEEKKGKDLFFSTKTNCSACHAGFLFTNQTFQNNGLYEQYADTGRQRITLLPIDRGLFKVPSLRNIALTAPYMHDGSFANLEAVIEHYNAGGVNNSNKSNLIVPLNLTVEEKSNLIAFLKSLTDNEFINNPAFKQ